MMSETPDEAQSADERLEDVEDRLLELEGVEDQLLRLDSSRRWHFWVLVLLVFTTCGYGTVDTTSDDTTGISNEVRGLRGDVRELGHDVERLNEEVERLRSELDSTQAALERLSDRQG
jgi:hypothetical protein